MSRGRLLAALLTIATGVLLLPPDDAAAQLRSRDEGLFEGPLSVGLRTGRDWTEKAWTIGGQAELPLKGSVKLRPSGDLLFPEDAGMGYQVNADAVIYLGQGGGLYAGGGGALVHPHGGDSEKGEKAEAHQEKKAKKHEWKHSGAAAAIWGLNHRLR